MEQSELNSRLSAAAKEGDAEAVESLLSNGAKPDAVNDEGIGETPLHLAAKGNHVACIRELIQRSANPNAAEKLLRCRPLHFVKSAAAANLLIKAGARAAAKDSDGATPLHWAALYGYAPVVKVFLKQGAKPNVATRNGETPLGLAALGGHPRVVEMLLQSGAKVKFAERKGGKPLMELARSSRSNVVGDPQKYPSERSLKKIESLLRAAG